MANHPNRGKFAPMQKASYLKVAGELRQLADILENNAEQRDSRERGTVTKILEQLVPYAARILARHKGQPSPEQQREGVPHD